MHTKSNFIGFYAFNFLICNSIGHVGISARHSNHFRVSVNTEAKSTVIFHLLYEELLQRKQGMYDHAINLTPRQKLKHFSIDVSFYIKKFSLIYENHIQADWYFGTSTIYSSYIYNKFILYIPNIILYLLHISHH